MLAPVTNGLPGSVRTDYVTYSATAFPWESNVYAKSKQQAVDNARGMIGAMAASCGDTRFAIVGYSQGADAAGDLAAEIGTGIGVVPDSRRGRRLAVRSPSFRVRRPDRPRCRR